ncbi:MAG: hypothetical protein Q4G47_02705 [Lachnospiraceae bacterium]|nr:hypothetical protein [Lachnospiraceae bacterium]
MQFAVEQVGLCRVQSMIADLIYVLSNGKCTAELTGEDITEDNLVLASYAGLGTGASANA